jgi:hypothetical protein
MSNNQKSLIKALKPYFRYSLELKALSPLIALLCLDYALREGELKVKEAEREVSKVSQTQTGLQLMPKKLQIDMTKTFLKQQRGENLETLKTLVKATGIKDGDYRLHLENFL